MSDHGSGVRVRLYVDGKVVSEEWLPAGPDAAADAAEAAQKQVVAAAEADAHGQVWMAELYDPDAPEGANAIRFGTDTSMMRAAMEITGPQGLSDAIANHPYHGWLHTQAELWSRRN